MRIAIDARGVNWYKGTGIGTYTDNVLSQLLNIDKENYYHIYWSEMTMSALAILNSKIIMTSNITDSFSKLYAQQPIKRKNRYLSCSSKWHRLMKILNVKVITVHDLIPYIMPETVGKATY